MSLPISFESSINFIPLKASWSNSFTFTRITWNAIDDTTFGVIGFKTTGSFNSYFHDGSGINFLVFDLPLTLESKNSAFDKSLTSFFRVWLPDEILKNEELHNEFIKEINKTRTFLPGKMSLSKLAVNLPQLSVTTKLKLVKFFEEKKCSTILRRALRMINLILPLKALISSIKIFPISHNNNDWF